MTAEYCGKLLLKFGIRKRFLRHAFEEPGGQLNVIDDRNLLDYLDDPFAVGTIRGDKVLAWNQPLFAGQPGDDLRKRNRR